MATLGTTLRGAREAKGVTTSQAALVTHIKTQMIERLEADDFSGIAAPIYGKGFIRIYAEYLGLDPLPLIEEYVTQCGTPPAPTLGRDTAGVVEHPGRGVEPEPPRPESAKNAWPKWEWPRLNVFRRLSLPREQERIKAMIAGDPVKFALIGLGVIVLVIFMVSGIANLFGTRGKDAARDSRMGDGPSIGREMPAPYLDPSP